jgi:ribosome-associated protein
VSPTALEILDGLEIPLSELSFETARSSGPGGQHVNKTETKVTLVFDLEASATLSSDQKAILRDRLASRISKEGTLRISSQSTRSQLANREDTIDRFTSLLRNALTPRPERKPTRTPKKTKRARLEGKRRQSEKKKLRKDPDWL